jgi:hypothetical protein
MNAILKIDLKSEHLNFLYLWLGVSLEHTQNSRLDLQTTMTNKRTLL